MSFTDPLRLLLLLLLFTRTVGTQRLQDIEADRRKMIEQMKRIETKIDQITGILEQPFVRLQTRRIRLTHGPSSYEGLLEVKIHFHWGLVCDDGFDMAAAKIACDELGFPRSYEKWTQAAAAQFLAGKLDHPAVIRTNEENFTFVPYDTFPEFKALNATRSAQLLEGRHILLDEIECKGSEESIFVCSHKVSPPDCPFRNDFEYHMRSSDCHDCSREEAVWLKCV